MRFHQEKPDTRIDRYICLALIIATILAGDYLLFRVIRSGRQQPHPLEFLGLALLAALLLYLLWNTINLFTVRYVLAEDHLILRQGIQKHLIPLDGSAQLCRWRYRWGWSDGPRRDLGVEEIALFPAVWFWRETPIWVIAYADGTGTRRAAAFRPSPDLLELLRDRAREGAGIA